MGYGVAVGHNAVEMLMSRAGIAGLPGNRRRKRKIPGAPTALDLVDRQFTRTEPDELWVTDIERHEAPLNRVVMKGHHGEPVAAGT